MSGYLLDTNVISELRKGQRCNSNVRRWFEQVDSGDIYLSVLVLGEIRRGIELIRRRDGITARQLDRWLKGLERRFEERVLPVAAAVCDRWGRLGLTQPIPPIDALLAATAAQHGLTLVTRNTSHLQRAEVELFNPFDPPR